MEEGTVGIAVLLLTSVLVARAVHKAVRSFVLACTIAAPTSAILFQVLAYLHAGHLDKFVIISVIISSLLPFVVAAVVGLVFKVDLLWNLA